MYVESPSATKILLKLEMLWVKTFQIAKVNTDKTSVTRVIPKNHSLLNLRFSRHKRRSRSRPGATFLTSVTWRTSAASYVPKNPMQHPIYQALQVSRQTRGEACGIMGRGRTSRSTLTVPLSYAHRDFPGAGLTTLKSEVNPVLKKLFALTPNGSRIQQLCLIRWALLCIQLAPA